MRIFEALLRGLPTSSRSQSGGSALPPQTAGRPTAPPLATSRKGPLSWRRVLGVGVALLAVPLGGCLEGGTCLRNSDCASTEVCSIGACIPAPADDGADGAIEGGAEGASDAATNASDVTVSSDVAVAVEAGDALADSAAGADAADAAGDR